MPDHVGLSSPMEDPDAEMDGVEPNRKISKPTIVQRLDKKQVEQRIEEDRERHKRLREQQWAIPKDDHDAEFEKMWDETSSLNSDDYQVFQEEAEQRDQCAREHAREMESLAATQNGD
jgi:CTD kinase subunit gamma